MVFLSDIGFSISIPASEYEDHLKQQGVNPSASTPFSTASNYAEFTGLDRKLNDISMMELGITDETIAVCVPGFDTK